MKKLIITLLLISTIAFSAFANGSSETAAPAATEATSSKPTVMLLTDATGIDDKSFNAAAWRGILSFYGESWNETPSRGKLYDVITASSQDMYIPNLKNAADQGYDLIITTGFTWADAIREVSAQYPDQNFMIVDVNWVGVPNVREYIYTEEQGSYLVGVLAAKQAVVDGISNPKFGFIGGVPGATITKFEMGYIQGIKSILPDAEILDYYANSWGSPELAKAQAKNWYDNGVYVIFSAAGGTGNGTISQAKEMRIAGKDVWAIGVDSDQFEDGIYSDNMSAVLTSMIKVVENSSIDALTQVANGTFTGGEVVMNMKDGGVDFSSKNPEIAKAAIDAAEAAKKAIISGDITVYGTYKAALAAGVVPAGLSALDD